MARYRLTSRARSGFRNILEDVENRFGYHVAEQVLDRIVAAFETLAGNPHIGHVREDLTSDTAILFWSVGPTLLAYRAVDEAIEVLFVERAEQDWEKLLQHSPE